MTLPSRRHSSPKSHSSSGSKRQLRSKLRGWLKTMGYLAATATLAHTAGCTRQQYRCKTDTEAYYLLDEKVAQSCEDNTATYRIEVDPRSRMFDPFNPDRPPMPEDDPQANRFMRMVDGKKGYPLWEANGRTNIVENPQWIDYLPLDERGVLVLELEDAVRLALLHSPGYQQNLETMYLSALDVSSERFLLDSQFFGGWQATSTARGDQLAGANGRTLVTTGPQGLRMNKAYATGADLLVSWANTFTWQVAGSQPYVSPSALSFNFVQPLLRNGGRDVVLERLTRAERTLLSNVRAFERYRRAFYLQIAIGLNPDTSPRRSGGAFGGAGLTGFDVLGSVFGGAGGGGGGGFAGGGGVPSAGGYLGLLQDQLNIANQKETIIRLQDLYLQLEDNYRELLLTMPATQTQIPSEQLQVAQAQQSVFEAQNQLLTQQAAYEASLDSFKQTLGLPPYLCIEIKGDLLEPFRLISQDLRDRRTTVAELRAQVGINNSGMLEMSDSARDESTGQAYRTIENSPQLQESLRGLRNQMTPVAQVLEVVLTRDVEAVQSDLELLSQAIPVRRQQLNRLKTIAEQERGMVCSLLPLGDFNTAFLDGEGLEQLPDELNNELNILIEKLGEQSAQLRRVIGTIDSTSNSLDSFADSRERFEKISQNVVLASQDIIAGINESVLALQLIQARARTEAVFLPEIDIEPRDAFEIAKANRRDWLNAKASLVTSWRAIEVVADDLESILDFTVTGNVGNLDGKNPFALHSSDGSLRVGLAWDAPITRLQERNNYRNALINYQQAKRSYYQYEDGIWTTVRSTLRSVRQRQLSFEIQRFAVQNAALQISVNEDIRQINETLGQSAGPTAARDAVQGLQAFLSTQSQLIGVFVNYEALRRSLDLNLGTMEVDGEGLWIDPGPIRPDTLGGALGDAIMEYGVPPGEMLMRDDIKIVDEPVAVGTTGPNVGQLNQTGGVQPGAAAPLQANVGTTPGQSPQAQAPAAIGSGVPAQLINHRSAAGTAPQPQPFAPSSAYYQAQPEQPAVSQQPAATQQPKVQRPTVQKSVETGQAAAAEPNRPQQRRTLFNKFPFSNPNASVNPLSNPASGNSR